MLDRIIPLLDSFFAPGVFVQLIVPVIALAFLACVPVIIRYVFRR